MVIIAWEVDGPCLSFHTSPALMLYLSLWEADIVGFSSLWMKPIYLGRTPVESSSRLFFFESRWRCPIKEELLLASWLCAENPEFLWQGVQRPSITSLAFRETIHPDHDVSFYKRIGRKKVNVIGILCALSRSIIVCLFWFRRFYIVASNLTY